MRLYGKTILIVALTILAVATLLLITFELTVMGSLSALEQDYVNQDLNRAQNVITRDLERLTGVAQDWAVWDAAYDYAENQNQDFLTSNFAQTTLPGLNIDVLALYDLNGTLITGLEWFPVPQSSGPVNTTLDNSLRHSGIRLTVPEMSKGIIAGDTSPLMIATFPILTSHMEGPARGTVVVADRVDDEKISMLSDSLLRNITLIQLSPGEIESLLSDYSQTGMFSSLSSDSRVITDISGTPLLIIRIPPSGDLQQSGLYSRVFLLASLLLLTLIFMGLASWLLNRIIILPLQVLNQDLVRIGQSGSLSKRIESDRSDEIGDLASSINTMLSSLEETQQERITSEQRLSKIIEIVGEGICLVGPDGLIWFANPTLALIFDTTPHDLTGMSLQSLLCVDDLQEFDTSGENPGKYPSDSNQNLNKEYPCQSTTGRDVWVRVTFTSYPLATGKTGILCVVNDITLFRTAERELLLSNKKLALLGSMTRHDIVNQLTTIRGMLGLVKLKNTDPVLDTLIRSAEDASEKIHKHVEFSKEYQKAGIEKPRWQDIRTVWNLAYAMARRRGLTFTITGDNYEIYADQLLQKVFYNLIDNSLRHGKDLFHITISTSIDEQDLLIFYEDDGGGIPDAMKGRIFERGVGSGTGWGLFFAHEVLELTGMTISESGTFGIGAIFVIRVPEGVFRPVMTESQRKEEETGAGSSPLFPDTSNADTEGYPGNQ